MAFMSLVFAGIFLVILSAIFITALVLFIIGACVRKKHRKASNVLYIIGGIFAGMIATILLLIFLSGLLL